MTEIEVIKKLENGENVPPNIIIAVIKLQKDSIESLQSEFTNFANYLLEECDQIIDTNNRKCDFNKKRFSKIKFNQHLERLRTAGAFKSCIENYFEDKTKTLCSVDFKTGKIKWG